jgi:hypothetical protein
MDWKSESGGRILNPDRRIADRRRDAQRRKYFVAAPLAFPGNQW